jgi:hypothetical protein
MIYELPTGTESDSKSDYENAVEHYLKLVQQVDVNDPNRSARLLDLDLAKKRIAQCRERFLWQQDRV